MDNSNPWTGLEEDLPEEEIEEKQLSEQEREDNHLAAIMFHLVNDNKEAFTYLQERFVNTAMAVPGDDMLQIGLRQGAANMLKWINNKSAENQTDKE